MVGTVSTTRLQALARGPLPCPPLGLDLILDENGQLQFVDRETGEIVVRWKTAAWEQAEKAQRQAEARRQAEQVQRRQIRDLCGLLGIEWTSERSAAVEGMDSAQLEALWADLMSQKRWPSSKPLSQE